MRFSIQLAETFAIHYLHFYLEVTSYKNNLLYKYEGLLCARHFLGIGDSAGNKTDTQPPTYIHTLLELVVKSMLI